MEQTIKKQDNKRSRKGISRAKLQEYLFVASLLAIPIFFFLIFWVYANVDSLLLAFQKEDYSGESMKLIFTFRNFEDVFKYFLKEKELLIAFRNTMLFFVVNLVIVIPLTLLMSYFIYKKIFGYKLFRTVAFLPNIICSSALVVLFKYTFMGGGTYNAIVGSKFKYLLETDNAILLLLLYNVIFGFGTNLVIFGGAMNSISKDVLEAGDIDGCNWFQELIYLIIPMMWPTISTLLILCFSSMFSATGPILAMTGGKHDTSSLAFMTYKYATGVTGEQNIYYASAIGMCMTAIAFPIVLIIRKVIFKEEKA